MHSPNTVGHEKYKIFIKESGNGYDRKSFVVGYGFWRYLLKTFSIREFSNRDNNK